MAKRIPKDTQSQVSEIVENFNKKNKTNFRITFRANYAYLSHVSYVVTKIGRLQYIDSTNKWSFAVFRYSREFYDPDEFMFPGWELLDGTIEGALNAGMELL